MADYFACTGGCDRPWVLIAKERIQKILAKAGVASRRKSEELIGLGEVTVNGKIAKLGDQADPAADAIKVSGKLLPKLETLVYYAFHKPRQVICSLADPEGRLNLSHFLKVQMGNTPVKVRHYKTTDTVVAAVPAESPEKPEDSTGMKSVSASDTDGRRALIKERVFPVGRLGYNSEGLVLLTNDGAFAEKLQRGGRIPRVYHVKVKGHTSQEMLKRLTHPY